MELAHARPAGPAPADKVRLLLIDDNRALPETMAETLGDSGYDCETATTSAEGARKIDSETFDIVLTDLRLDGADGLALLRRAKQLSAEPEVIVITGHGDVKTAVEAMQHGAFSFLEKGPNMTGALRAQVQKAVDHLRLNRANTELKRQLDEKFGFEGVVGNSPRMKDMIAQLRAVAPTSATVLVLGENGTGKELVARALHYNSPRAKKNFVAMNCTAL